MKRARSRAFADRTWDDEIVPALTDYIAIPAKSPMFDADWQQHGYIERVVRDAARWVEQQQGRGPEARDRAPRRPHAGDLLRGAGDAAGQHRHRAAVRPPRQAARVQRLARATSARGRRSTRDGQLYGRGGADDGYAVYAAHHRDRGARRAGHRRGRAASASSRPARRAARSTCRPTSTRCSRRLGDVGLVVCLDSRRRQLRPAVADDQSCAALVSGTLKVEMLTEGVHSGDASGAGAVELPHPAPAARPARRREDRPPAAAELPLRDPGRAHARRRARPRRSSATRSGSASRGPAAPTAARRCRPPPTRARRC